MLKSLFDEYESEGEEFKNSIKNAKKIVVFMILIYFLPIEIDKKNHVALFQFQNFFFSLILHSYKFLSPKNEDLHMIH